MVTFKKSFFVVFFIAIIFPIAFQAAQGPDGSIDIRAQRIKALKQLFMVSVLRNDTDMFLRLFEHGPRTLTRLQLQNGASPLLVASKNGNVRMVDALLAHGAEIDQPMHQTGLTALIAASAKGHTSVVQKLVMHGANLNAIYRSPEQQTPLIAASRRGHVAVVSYLALLPERQEYEKSLIWAIYAGHPAVVSALKQSVSYSKRVEMACIKTAERMNEVRVRQLSVFPKLQDDAPALPMVQD